VLAQNTPEKLAEALHRIYESFPQEPPKGIAEAAGAWLRARTKPLVRRRHTPPAIIGLLPGKYPGILFNFLRDALRQSSAIVLRNAITEDCRSYLADASWLSSNDPKKSVKRKIVLVTDHPAADLPPLADGVILPSFKALSALPHSSGVVALVVPPVLDGSPFDPEIPLPEQLTSTVAGVVQAIRQLFLVLDAPRDVPWLGFR
jgi:hypothetical protein